MVDRSYKSREVLERLYLDEEKTTYEIAELADCSQVTISNWLNEFVISTREDEPPEELKDKSYLEREYKEKERSINSITNELECGWDTVCRWLGKHEIEIRDTNYGNHGAYPELKDEEWMQEWYCEKQLSYKEIGEKLGCHPTTVGDAIEELENIEPRGLGGTWEPPISKERLEELYYGQMLSLEKIADRFDTSASSIRTWCQHYDIETRSRGAMFSGEEHHLYKDGNGGVCYGAGWPKQRKKALERDDYECRDCGMDDTEHREAYGRGLHVHHIERYDPDQPVEPQHREDNLLSLCQSCHLGKWERADDPMKAKELLPN